MGTEEFKDSGKSEKHKDDVMHPKEGQHRDHAEKTERQGQQKPDSMTQAAKEAYEYMKTQKEVKKPGEQAGDTALSFGELPEFKDQEGLKKSQAANDARQNQVWQDMLNPEKRAAQLENPGEHIAGLQEHIEKVQKALLAYAEHNGIETTLRGS